MAWVKALSLWLALEGTGLSTDNLGYSTFMGVRKDEWTNAGHDYWPPKNQSEIASFLFDRYWSIAHCPDLPEQCDAILFQAAGHLGPTKALEVLQISVCARPIDAVWGPETQRRVSVTPKSQLADTLLSVQDAYYFYKATNRDMLKGFLNRTDTVRDWLAMGKL